jgi:misacylated tRNA(Ala) deacylase
MILCQKDSYVKEYSGVVIASEPTEDGFRILIENSIFFPEGGGQPADCGWVNSIKINDVQKIDGKAWHFMNEKITLGDCQQKIDWSRRFDHMQQHTGQHLLTAVIVEKYGFQTVGFHLGEEVSTIDLDTPSLDAGQFRAIEDAVDNAIQGGGLVRAKVLSIEEFNTDVNIRSRGLPSGFVGDVRIIEIEGIDSNTCGGTHVSSLSELQSVLLLKTERLKGKMRLHFLFGKRVKKFLHKSLQREKQLTSIFNQGSTEHVQIARKWELQRKEFSRTIKSLQQELSGYLGKALLESQPSILYRPNADLSTLSKIAAQATMIDPDARFALTGNGVFLVQSSMAHSNKDEILSVIEGRGGGKSPRLQGKCKFPSKVEQLQNLI